VRKLAIYVKKYGPEAGPKLYHALQSQAAHAGVSARRKRTIEALTRSPLFPERPARVGPAA